MKRARKKQNQENSIKREEMIKNRRIFIVLLFSYLFYIQLEFFSFGFLTSQVFYLQQLNDLWQGPLMQAGIFLAIVFFVLWGFLYDRHNRKRLLSVAAFLFGTTSVLLGVAPTYATYIFSFTAINISRASQPGIIALVGDYFSPKLRGRIIGLFLSTQPLALILVLFLVPLIEPALSFRYIYLIFGAVGFLFALMIFLWLGEPKRGAKEPALAQIQMTGVYLFDWENAKGFLRRPCMLYIYALSFFAVFPWSVNLFWIHRYLTHAWGLPELIINLSLLPAILTLAAGYFLGGFLGDLLFTRWRTGRIWVLMIGLVLPAVFFYFSMQTSGSLNTGFIALMTIMGLFTSFTWPNIIAAIFDVTLPEIRATAVGFMLMLQAFGLIFSSNIVSFLQTRIELDQAIISVALSGWLISLPIAAALLISIPRGIEKLRRHMAYRSHLEARLTAQEK